MKKKLAAIVVCVFVSVFFCGCKTALEKYDSVISEIRSDLYEGVVDGIKVTAITGYREEPFEIDGIAGTRQSFTVITVFPTEVDVGEKYTYTARIGEAEYSGNLAKHPFNNTYSAEISSFTTCAQIEFAFKRSGKEKSVSLVSIVGKDFINAEKALDIAVKKLKKGILSMRDNNLSYEVYVRLVENPITSSGGYHWYVAFVGADETTYAVLIEPSTMEIVAIRE